MTTARISAGMVPGRMSAIRMSASVICRMVHKYVIAW